MSIKYRLTPMKDNNSASTKKGFYAQVVTKGTIDSLQLCEEIADSCNLSTGELMNAIAAITSSVSEKLRDGYNVCIDELGTFSISAESELLPCTSEVTEQCIKVKKINFRPSVGMKKTMKNSHFVPIAHNEE